MPPGALPDCCTRWIALGAGGCPMLVGMPLPPVIEATTLGSRLGGAGFCLHHG